MCVLAIMHHSQGPHGVLYECEIVHCDTWARPVWHCVPGGVRLCVCVPCVWEECGILGSLECEEGYDVCVCVCNQDCHVPCIWG